MLPWKRLHVNLSHGSLISSEGKPGGVGRAATIPDLLTRTPGPQRDLLLDLLLDSRPNAPPSVSLLVTMLSGSVFCPSGRTFFCARQLTDSGFPHVPVTKAQIVSLFGTALETRPACHRARGHSSTGARMKRGVTEKADSG